MALIQPQNQKAETAFYRINVTSYYTNKSHNSIAEARGTFSKIVDSQAGFI